MGRSAHELAMRDPARAALMGVDGMSDFGGEPEMFGAEGSDFGIESIFGGGGLGGSVFGDEYGDEMGAEVGAEMTVHDRRHPLHHPNPHARRIIEKHLHRTRHTQRRAMLLEPNMNSELKIERYTFSVNANITLGTASAILATGSPDVNFRPERVTMNVVSPGMIFITDGRVANVSFTVGGQNDAWQFNANAVGQSLSVPTLTPANRATVSGTYLGLVPSPLSGTGAYTFCTSFSGPATLSA